MAIFTGTILFIRTSALVQSVQQEIAATSSNTYPTLGMSSQLASGAEPPTTYPHRQGFSPGNEMTWIGEETVLGEDQQNIDRRFARERT